MSDYSSAQMMQMQQDAIRRVHEMQRIARERVAAAGAPAEAEMLEEAPSLSQNKRSPHQNQHAVVANSSLLHPNAFGGFLGKLGLEQDQLILAGIILMLINEGADNLLILALCYILL